MQFEKIKYNISKTHIQESPASPKKKMAYTDNYHGARVNLILAAKGLMCHKPDTN